MCLGCLTRDTTTVQKPGVATHSFTLTSTRAKVAPCPLKPVNALPPSSGNLREILYFAVRQQSNHFWDSRVLV